MKAGGKNGSHFCSCTARRVRANNLPGNVRRMSQVPFGAVKSLTRLSPFSAKPKRRPHFGGEGYSRGAKMDPVFAPVRGFNASYGHLRILCGSLRPPTYFGQTKGALSVVGRNTALRQNEAETKATRSFRSELLSFLLHSVEVLYCA